LAFDEGLREMAPIPEANAPETVSRLDSKYIKSLRNEMMIN
jgi:hypothetical protein